MSVCVCVCTCVCVDFNASLFSCFVLLICMRFFSVLYLLLQSLLLLLIYFRYYSHLCAQNGHLLMKVDSIHSLLCFACLFVSFI